MSSRKTGLVTGSTAGLGLATAEALARAGHDVVLHGLMGQEEGERIAQDLASRFGVSAHYVQADLASPEGVASMIEAAVARAGAIDILVNNAVTRNFAHVEELAAEDWERALSVNLSAPFHAIRLVLPGMRQRGFGRIVNYASIYSFRAAARRVDYVTAKTAILGLTRTVALEVAGTDISCNAICPGTLPTPDIEARIARIAAEEGKDVETATREYLSARQPSGRFISLAAVTDLVVFLCRPGMADINGAAIPVDAGWAAA
jgi:Dehydrogenases with different specificities (related to short-chain alcohol dehydrogenases)